MSPKLKLWLVGLAEAAMSGGTTMFSTNLVDPGDFNIYTKKFWMASGASALVSTGKYIYRTTARLQAEAQAEIDPKQPQLKGP